MIEPVKPPRLRPGQHIRVVAPAGRVDGVKLRHAVEEIRGLGYTVSLGPHVETGFGYWAAGDAERAHDLNQAIRDPEVDAVFFARGGYGAMRILDDLEWSWWRRRPKILLGYSDCTALLASLYRHEGGIGFHGPVVESGDWSGANGQRALRLLNGESGRLHQDPLISVNGVMSPTGGTTGTLMGGNLSLVAALLATGHSWPFNIEHPVVLYLEDVGEAPYRLDRLLVQCRLAGVFERVSAVIFGEAWQCDAASERPGFSADEVIASELSRLKVPAFVGLPAGHGPHKETLPMGARVRLQDHWLELLEPAVI